MKIKKLLLVASIHAVFVASPVFAGDVEVSLPAATDAFTVDQPAGTELMRVNGNGNVGIGTTTPAQALHVIGGLKPLRLERKGVDAWEASIDANRLHFYNPSTDTYPLSMNKNGDVGIGTTAPAEKLHVYGGVRFEGLAAGSTGNYLCRTTAGVITHGGSCSTSDERLKKDIVPVTGALDKLQQMQGVTYKWKDEARGTRTELGLIAQEVEKVIPEVVDTSNDEMGTKSIRYENLVAVLIEGMKEQQAQITAQQQRIDALEAKLK